MVKYQHPDDKNDAYIPKLVVLLGFVLAGGTVFLLPLDVANNSNFAGELYTRWRCSRLVTCCVDFFLISHFLHSSNLSIVPQDARVSTLLSVEG